MSNQISANTGYVYISLVILVESNDAVSVTDNLIVEMAEMPLMTVYGLLLVCKQSVVRP
jgi:hypothetical protein